MLTLSRRASRAGHDQPACRTPLPPWRCGTACRNPWFIAPRCGARRSWWAVNSARRLTIEAAISLWPPMPAGSGPRRI